VKRWLDRGVFNRRAGSSRKIVFNPEESEMKAFAVMAAGIALAAGSMSVVAADLDAGKGKYQQVCASCHGAEGKGQAIFPGIAGQDAEYVAGRLQQYRAGEQVGPTTALMAPHAAALSDDDIANVSAYIAAEFK
jgi:cytochrome c553